MLLTTHHEFIEVESEVADVGLALADGDGARGLAAVGDRRRLVFGGARWRRNAIK